MKAAIHLSSYNKKYYLMMSLYSLLNQDCDFDYRVYLHEHSDDYETVQYAFKFENNPKLVFIHDDDDPIRQRNEFYRDVPADYLFMTHDDIILHPDFLKKMCGEMDKGHDAYCAMELVRSTKSIEMITEKPVVYVPSDPPESLHGMMELFQMGIRKETMEKYEHPLYKDHDWKNAARACDENQNAMDRLQRVGSFYPVIKNGKTDVLLTHIVSEFSFWNFGKGVK